MSQSERDRQDLFHGFTFKPLTVPKFELLFCLFSLLGSTKDSRFCTPPAFISAPINKNRQCVGIQAPTLLFHSVYGLNFENGRFASWWAHLLHFLMSFIIQTGQWVFLGFHFCLMGMDYFANFREFLIRFWHFSLHVFLLLQFG